MDRKLAVVTGANRGMGLETSRQLAKLGYKVIMTSRDRDEGLAAGAGGGGAAAAAYEVREDFPDP